MSEFPPFESLKRVHVIGVCGTLMAPFAAFLKRRGVDVTGSDQAVYPPMSDLLREAGVELMEGYRAENVTQAPRGKPELVVIGNVISQNHPEARAAIDGGLAYCSFPEALENLILGRTRNFVVAGTHGKTTTSSMLAHVFNVCGRDPNYLIGGVPWDLPHSFQVTSTAAGHPFVMEGDEYDTAFWDKVPKFFHYKPDRVILTSVEFDHADIYADLEAVERAFRGLVERIRPGGILVACGDYPTVRKAAAAADSSIRRIFYGFGADADFRVVDFEPRGAGCRFRVEETATGRSTDISVSVPGRHNALNATAVWIQATHAGLSSADVARALESFRGVRRRQELRGEIGGVRVIDDFAHHPTAVRETLAAIKASVTGRGRLLVAFEPRSATSRRKVFQKDYAAAFAAADQIWISTPYDQSKIPAADQFSSAELVADLVRRGKRASEMTTVETGVSEVCGAAKEGDTIAVLSNGGFGGFVQKTLDRLKAAEGAAEGKAG